MIGVRLVDREEAESLTEYTFPAMRHALTTKALDRRVIAAAHSADDPIGLAFGVGNEERAFELASVYVSPFWRRQGVGRRLLEAVEHGFQERGYDLGVHLFTVGADEHDAARFLVQCGWARPAVRQVVCLTDMERTYRSPLPRLGRMPPGYQAIRWCDLSPAQRAGIVERHRREAPWYPEDLSPFLYEPGCAQETSLALVKGSSDGEVVGWVISHVIDDDTVRYTCSFVSQELQHAGRIMPLWWATAQRQAERTRFSRVIWTVPVQHASMATFATRRMKSWMIFFGYACTAVKRL